MDWGHIPCFLSFSVELDDPEFVKFMKMDKDATEMAASGFVEDMFPIMCKIWTTNKYRTVIKMFDEIISLVKRKFEEHDKTFSSGMLASLICLLQILIIKYQSIYRDLANSQPQQIFTY